MARVGKHTAGVVPASAPSIKSRGLKNPTPSDFELGQDTPDMSKGNDGKSGKKETPPASGKKTPGESK